MASSIFASSASGKKDGNLIECADLPGLNKDDVKVEVTGQGLAIQGERKREHEEKKEGYYRSERTHGRFSSPDRVSETP